MPARRTVIAQHALVALYSQRSTGLSQVLQPLRNRYVASTGISVSASSMEPSSA